MKKTSMKKGSGLIWTLIIVAVVCFVFAMFSVGNAVANQPPPNWDMKVTDMTLRHVVSIAILHALFCNFWRSK